MYVLFRRLQRRKILFMVTVLALALVTAELAARIATRPRDALMNDTLVGLRDDPLLFWTMEPGYELRMQHGGNVFINSLGLRNEEIDIPKPKGIYRVLSLGESTTFGAFLNVDDTYNKVLQRVLNAEWRHRSPAIDAVEVVNAGMGAYTVWQSYVYVMTRAENLAPDMVLVYHEINDSLPSGVIDAHNFLYRLDTTDRKIYERRRPIAPLLGVLFHSRAYLLLRKWILQLPSDLPEIRVTDRIDRKKGEGAEPRQSNVRPNFIQDWTERYAPRVPPEDRRVALSGILEWCRAHGAEMVIVQPIYIEDPKTPLLADFARENNVRYVNLPALLAEDRARGGMFLDGVHPSDIGHRLIGRALARELFGVDKPDAG